MTSEQLSILVIGRGLQADDRARRLLERQFALVEWARDMSEAVTLLPRCHFDCVLIEAQFAEDPALAGVAALRRDLGPGRAILATGTWHRDLPAAALRAGADDFLALPLEGAALGRALRRQPAGTRQIATPGAPAVELVGDSPAIRRVRQLVARIAPTPATVLLEGETGTGKELVARLLHGMSQRAGPFVPVNCGAIAPELMESELFGHAKGAFTGAHQVREGLFQAASGGTLFLDEIAAMRRDLQVKLLRALEEGAIRAVGSDREVPVNTRIVASVQPGLAARVADGRFREDLFYRLNVAHILLPPRAA